MLYISNIWIFIRNIYLQNSKYSVKGLCISHLSLVDIPSFLLFFKKNRGDGWGFTLQTKSAGCDINYLLMVPIFHKRGLTAPLPPILRHPTLNPAWNTFLKSFFPIPLFLFFEFLNPFIDLSGYKLWDIFRFI